MDRRSKRKGNKTVKVKDTKSGRSKQNDIGAKVCTGESNQSMLLKVKVYRGSHTDLTETHYSSSQTLLFATLRLCLQGGYVSIWVTLAPGLHTQKRHRPVTACCTFRPDTDMIS